MVVIDHFSKFGWIVPLKNKNGQTITNSFENFLISSKRRPNLIESDDGSEFGNKKFTDFSNENNIKRYSRYTSLGTVFAERFNRTVRDLLKRPIFEKGDGNWINVLSVIIKQYKNRRHSTTKLTPIQASLRKTEVMFTLIC